MLRRVMVIPGEEAPSGADRTQELPARVRAVLLAWLGDGRPSEAQVAELLDVSRRSLQRRLRSHGTCYRELLEATLQMLAERDLADPSLSVADVALRLGFSDPANFSRAFRRWTGRSPQAFRPSRSGPDRARDVPRSSRRNGESICRLKRPPTNPQTAESRE